MPMNRSLRILMLTWEYPPMIVGGLSRSVHGLAVHLAELNHEIHVITRSAGFVPEYEYTDRVHVHRVSVNSAVSREAFAEWVLLMNIGFVQHTLKLWNNGMRFHLIHAHDWLVHDSAEEMGEFLGIPIIATLHATEAGRFFGRLDTDLQKTIHAKEFRMSTAADRIIVCSRAMEAEVNGLFRPPPHKVSVLPNGFDPADLSFPTRLHRERKLLAAQRTCPDAKVKGIDILYVGRLVHEKGIHNLIEAMPAILRMYPQTRLWIVGDGPKREALIASAQRLAKDRVFFTGRISDRMRRFLLSAADVCVVPSLYEPFGIAALEAMAAGIPVVASETGGLPEIVRHNETGLTAAPGSPQALAEQILALLNDPEKAQRLTVEAKREIIEHFNWQSIAEATARLYGEVLKAQ
ncbi:glycosyltransferase family 4 protein [Ferviditalea candida]|uniref:Glycosyltransferase family 4 protein n=1 Tax=Ferviditalea candida TaxID=3108399 RepID=A0ABU5ZGQ8_9BACL|nr:glycosyltransferase family 4 protein [Paenibacillaceae bacterium T2]